MLRSVRIWFKGHNESIPLGTCRKNLMSVDFSRILNLAGNDTEPSMIHDIHVTHMAMGQSRIEEVSCENQGARKPQDHPPKFTRQ